jgi:hypothetical protein
MSKSIELDKLIHDLKGNIRDQRLILDDFLTRLEKQFVIDKSVNKDMKEAIERSISTWNELQLYIQKNQDRK